MKVRKVSDDIVEGLPDLSNAICRYILALKP